MYIPASKKKNLGSIPIIIEFGDFNTHAGINYYILNFRICRLRLA